MSSQGSKGNTEYKKLISDMKAGTIGRLYVFFGEEDYLKSHYLGRLKAQLCGAFEDFNYTRLEGDRLRLEDLTDALYTIPLGSERKLVVVRDYKLMQPSGELKEALPQLLAELPEYICLVFLFEGMAFKADKRLGIYKTVSQHGSLVEFERAPATDLIPWVKRRFHGSGKSIDTPVCDHLLFLCGYNMTNLITEIEKISAGTKGNTIQKADVDALASRVLEADVFDLTNCLADGNYQKGLHILRDLIDMRQEPVGILAAIIRQLDRLYGARLALDARLNESAVMELLGYRSSYPARLMLSSARRLKLGYLREAQHRCLACDLQLKSNIADNQRTLELLLLQLAQGAGA